MTELEEVEHEEAYSMFTGTLNRRRFLNKLILWNTDVHKMTSDGRSVCNGLARSDTKLREACIMQIVGNVGNGTVGLLAIDQDS